MKRSRFSEEQIIGILKEHQAGRDYGFPHSADAQMVGSVITVLGIDAETFAVNAEIETGAQVAGDNDYDTTRVHV